MLRMIEASRSARGNTAGNSGLAKQSPGADSRGGRGKGREAKSENLASQPSAKGRGRGRPAVADGVPTRATAASRAASTIASSACGNTSGNSSRAKQAPAASSQQRPGAHSRGGRGRGREAKSDNLATQPSAKGRGRGRSAGADGVPTRASAASSAATATASHLGGRTVPVGRQPARSAGQEDEFWKILCGVADTGPKSPRPAASPCRRRPSTPCRASGPQMQEDAVTVCPGSPPRPAKEARKILSQKSPAPERLSQASLLAPMTPDRPTMGGAPSTPSVAFGAPGTPCTPGTPGGAVRRRLSTKSPAHKLHGPAQDFDSGTSAVPLGSLLLQRLATRTAQGMPSTMFASAASAATPCHLERCPPSPAQPPRRRLSTKSPARALTSCPGTPLRASPCTPASSGPGTPDPLGGQVKQSLAALQTGRLHFDLLTALSLGQQGTESQKEALKQPRCSRTSQRRPASRRTSGKSEESRAGAAEPGKLGSAAGPGSKRSAPGAEAPLQLPRARKGGSQAEAAQKRRRTG
eukprot:TRINITY_DN16183_c0_g1_i1.p1 TRINITY_DN16183_c0_g1~~TRINITY_DN16183_c0_g1_i1.p1  ORF type:complete len:524 (-),score=67.99 TRINITY_DN16183_c0_g1_i1:183-1754(-)